MAPASGQGPISEEAVMNTLFWKEVNEGRNVRDRKRDQQISRQSTKDLTEALQLKNWPNFNCLICRKLGYILTSSSDDALSASFCNAAGTCIPRSSCAHNSGFQHKVK